MKKILIAVISLFLILLFGSLGYMLIEGTNLTDAGETVHSITQDEAAFAWAALTSVICALAALTKSIGPFTADAKP